MLRPPPRPRMGLVLYAAPAVPRSIVSRVRRQTISRTADAPSSSSSSVFQGPRVSSSPGTHRNTSSGDRTAAWTLRALLLRKHLHDGEPSLLRDLRTVDVADGSARNLPDWEWLNTVDSHLRALTSLLEQVMACPALAHDSGSSSSNNSTALTARGRPRLASQLEAVATLSGVAEDAARVARVQDALTRDVLHYLALQRSLRAPYQISSRNFPTTTTSITPQSASPFGVSARAEWPWREEARVLLALVVTRQQRETVAGLELLLHAASASGWAATPCVAWLLQQVDQRLADTAGMGPSALPWLLYRLSKREIASAGGAGLRVTPEEVSRWANSVTECICAATWAELSGHASASHRSDAPAAALSGTIAVTSAPGSAEEEEGSLFPACAAALRLFTVPSPRWTATASPSAQGCSRVDAVAPMGGGVRPLQSYACLGGACVETMEGGVLARYWELAITELLRSAWEVLDLCDNVGDGTHSSAQQAAPRKPQRHHGHPRRCSGAAAAAARRAEFAAVGAYQSIRRIIGSFGKHNRLVPILYLHERTSGIDSGSSGSTGGDGALAARWYSRIQSGDMAQLPNGGALLWRETVLVDAATLITAGHASEFAVDAVGPTGPGKSAMLTRVALIQDACVRHLRLLEDHERSLSRGHATTITTTGVAGAVVTPAEQALLCHLTPRTRANLIVKLQEGLRLSTKLFLRMGDYGAVSALHARCPAIGGSWEMGKALLLSKRPVEALAAFEGFLQGTRRRFVAGVPPGIQSLILEAVSGAAAAAVLNEVSAFEATDDGVGVAEQLAGRLLRDHYEHLHTSLSPLHPALCFDALLRGVLQCGDNAASSVGGGGEAAPACELASTNDAAVRILVVATASALLRQFVIAHGETDGLLCGSVGALVAGFFTSVPEQKRAPGLALLMEAQFLTAIITTMRACPYMPVMQETVAVFLREDYRIGVHALLRSLATDFVGRYSKLFIQAMLDALSPECQRQLDAVLRSGAALNDGGTRMEEIELDEGRGGAVREALAECLRRRQRVEEQRRPWQCFACHSWNSRSTHACTLCGALEAAVIQCSECNGFDVTPRESCVLCGAAFTAPCDATSTTTIAHGPSWSDRTNDSETAEVAGRRIEEVACATHVKQVYPMRPWRCTDCQHRNGAQHIFFCSACRHPAPLLESALAESAFTCSGCGRGPQPLGMARPWCTQCGTLAPTVAAAVAGRINWATLWVCVQCRHLNLWMLNRCEGCQGGRRPEPPELGAVALTPRINVQWVVQVCDGCQVSNPPGARLCRGCGDQLPSQLGATEAQWEAWYQSILREETETPTAENISVTRALGTRRVWVCLQGNCLHVNTEVAVITGHEGDSAVPQCGRCGTARGFMQTLTPEITNPLGYRQAPLPLPSPCGDTGELPVEDHPEREPTTDSHLALPDALALQWQRMGCSSCGGRSGEVEVSMVAGVCPRCGHCAAACDVVASACETAVRLRLILREMWLRVGALSVGRRHGADNAEACELVRSGARVLAEAPEALLPWRGVDLSCGRCCVKERVMVLADGEDPDKVHADIVLAREVIDGVCGILEGSRGPDVDVAAWLQGALDLVDTVNRSTDFDEIGFATLARLCRCMRPDDDEHIQQDTRWAYLRDMKLTRANIVHGARCHECLGPPHSGIEWCPHLRNRASSSSSPIQQGAR